MHNNHSTWGESEDNQIKTIGDNLFVLLKVVDSMCTEISSDKITSIATSKYLRDEIYWVQLEFSSICKSLTSLLNVYPDHPQALNLSHKIDEIEKQIRKVRRSVLGIIAAKRRNPTDLDDQVDYLDSLSGTLMFYLSDFHNILRFLGGRPVSGLI
ncbi:MAG: hypothetical protein QNJ45_16200 [Ardenticatenaceae bacterium]|nr:hypothetical protein [Ardenticatenaceae bacterium]